MKKALPLETRGAALAVAAKLIESAAAILRSTGWVQDRIDFAPEANALVKKLRAESRASRRLARKG